MIESIIIFTKFFMPILYGIVENRLFFEAGDEVVLKHFRLYHVWLGVLFAINSITPDPLLSMFIFIYSPLALDVVWWVITWKTTNRWHTIDDWDNYGNFPLTAKCYTWWWILCCILVILGALIIGEMLVG